MSVVWLLLRLPISELADAVIRTLLEATFHMFALITAIATRESELANEKTQRLNRELIATQHLLGEASRDSERTRIARDLHDLLGHHLTALTIHLQVAGRLSEGKAKESVDQCYALSKLLLSDVRQSVSQLKEMPTVSLAELLEITVNDIPRLDISLDIESHIDLNDVDTADTLLRFVQEAITNTLRHSNARKATISAVTDQSQITVTYSDNGGGCDTFEAGNGINGMIERLERLGGKLSIECQPTLTLKAIAPLVD